MTRPDALPPGLELARTTPDFDTTSVPAGLLAAHRVADGVWGRIRVLAGSLGFVFEDDPSTATPRHLTAGDTMVIPPADPHHLVLDQPVRFHVEFHRPDPGVDPDLAALRTLADHLAPVIEAAAALPPDTVTPCAEWDVADLLDHVTGGNRFTVEILEGATADTALATTMASLATSERDDVDLLGTMLSTFATADLEGSYDHVAGALTGRAILRLRLHDLIVHAWDLGQTLTPPVPLPGSLVTWGLIDLADPASTARAHFGVEHRIATDDRSAATGYLAQFGR